MKSRIPRRQFLQSIAAAGAVSMTGRAAASGTQAPPKFQGMPPEGKDTPKICLGYVTPDEPSMRRVKQIGVDYVLTGGPAIPWTEADIRARIDRYKAGGLTLFNLMISGFNDVIWDRPGADAQIADVITSIRTAGKAGLRRKATRARMKANSAEKAAILVRRQPDVACRDLSMLSLICFLAGEGHVQPLCLHRARDKLAGAVETGFHQGRSQVQGVGNFLIGEVMPVAQKQNRAIFDRQRIEDALHVVGGFMAQSGLLWSWADIGDPFQERHILQGQCEKTSTPKLVNRKVRRNGEQPGAEPMRLFVGVQLGVGADKSFLGDVLRLGGITEHAVGDIEHRIFVLLNERRKCLLITRKRSAHESSVLNHIGHPRRRDATRALFLRTPRHRATQRFTSSQGSTLDIHPGPPSFGRVPYLSRWRLSPTTSVIHSPHRAVSLQHADMNPGRKCLSEAELPGMYTRRSPQGCKRAIHV